MATVIKFKKKSRDESGPMDLQDGIARELRDAGIKSFLFETLLPLRQHLSSMGGHVHQGSVREQGDVVRKYTDNELKTAVQNSSKLDWSAKPAYYWALVFEAESRGLLF
ncbi:MAG: hypothetical protein Q7R58_01470 [bacterium]|nr:hypothetical protein [bacterium]